MGRTPLPRMTHNENRELTHRSAKRNQPVRKCVLSGERAENDALVRLAMGPDGQVAPDVHGKAPGRGAWIGVDAETLRAAQAKGKLAGKLRHAFHADRLVLPENLAEMISAALEKAVLDRLGLEARAGNLICGADKIDMAARCGQVALLLHAQDASADGAGKRDQAWRVGEGQEGSGKKGIRLPFDRDMVSAALGRNNAVHIAIIDEKAADRVMHHLGRWLNFNRCGNDIPNAKAVGGAETGSTPNEE